jgi:hypothetical protein
MTIRGLPTGFKGCQGKGGEIYIFDMGKPVKIIDFAKKMIGWFFLFQTKTLAFRSWVCDLVKINEELPNDTSKNGLPTIVKS